VTSEREPPGYEIGYVTRVVDGDTIEVRIDERAEGPGSGATELGFAYDVRLVGIDAPESVAPHSPVECFGRESSDAAEALLEGADVRLVKDVEDKDHYGRLLRYVYLRDEMANARLVLNGYAAAYPYPPNIRHSELFVQLEREARENDRGLWSSDNCDGEP
jgi:micrococcal nuclease